MEQVHRGLRYLVVLAVLAGAGGVGFAQSTGGSMGGGSFGGGSSGGGGGGGGSFGGGSSSSSSWGGSSSSYSGGGAGCSDLDPGMVFLLILVVAGVVVVQVLIKSAQQKSSFTYTGFSYAPEPPRIDVSVLRLALDWKARAFVQKELARIAASCDTKTSAGLLTMLREAALTLRRSRDSWVYAGAVNFQPMDPATAEARFQGYAVLARVGFQHELVRASDGAVTTGATPDDLRARSEEGPGLVLITLVVAAKEPLLDFQDASDAEQVRRWLEAISQLTVWSLAAVEIVWTPAAEEDRMSSIELEHLYPEIKRIRGDTLVGRATCRYCGGQFPAELINCAHCGARIDQAA